MGIVKCKLVKICHPDFEQTVKGVMSLYEKIHLWHYVK
jgi:hypothetical protein